MSVSTFFVLHFIPFSTGTSTCLAGVHLCCLTYHTFLYRYVYLPFRCPPLLSYISYLSLQVRLPALPVSTFVVLHIIPFSTGKFTCLAGVHLFCLAYHTFLYRYVYLPCRCPPLLSYISYLSLQVSLPALPVSTFFVLHIIPFSTGTSTCLAGVHLFCLTYHTFLYRYVYLPCRCPPFLSYISYLSLQVRLPALPVSTFFVLHLIPFSAGTSTCLAGVHLFLPTFHTFLYRIVNLCLTCLYI